MLISLNTFLQLASSILSDIVSFARFNKAGSEPILSLLVQTKFTNSSWAKLNSFSKGRRYGMATSDNAKPEIAFV